MNPGDRFYNQWPGGQSSSNRRFYPIAGTFSDIPPTRIRQQPQNLEQPFLSPFQQEQYISPQQLFQPPQIPFSNPEIQPSNLTFAVADALNRPFQDVLNREYSASDPVVHEGYIPAPGQEAEDDYPTLPAAYRDSLFQSYLESSDEDSEQERRKVAEHERLLEAADHDDVEADADYSTDDAVEDAGDPDEMDLGEDFEDEEPRSSRPRSSKPGTRGSRGGRRGRPPGRGRGGLGRSTSTRGGRTGKPGRPKGRRGPRAVADPGPEFRDLQRLANEAYMKRDFATALEYGQKAVQINPEIFNAHNLVSEIYEAMGDEQRSLEALIIGAPTKRDPGLWALIIERINKVDPDKYPLFTEDAKIAMILGCLKSLILLDPLNYEARSQKLEIESNLGHVSRCVKLCRKMLSIRPGDSEVLRIMATMGTSSRRQTNIHLSKIIDSFEKSFDHYIENDSDPTTSRLDWELLNIYLDLLDRTGDYDYALQRLKTLSRWKQKRAAESYWDDEDDDREFDIEDVPRRIAVPQFSLALAKGSKYGKTLPLEIRVKMGLFRLNQDPPRYSEAMHHLEMLDPDNHGPDALIWDYEDLFRIIADALHVSGHDRDALRFYEPLHKHESNELGLMSYIGIHTCYKNLGEDEKAEQIIPVLKRWHASDLDDLAVLATFFEGQGMQEEAMERGESVYRNGGAYKLRKLGFKGYEQLKEYFFQKRKQARGKHIVKKTRVKKYRTLLQKATRKRDGEGDGENSANEGSENRGIDTSLPSLQPLNRPAQGLFRTRKLLPATKPQAFLPIEPEPAPPSTIEGTSVPVEAIDHRLFRRKLKNLASDFADDLKSARAQHREIVASFKRLEEISGLAEDGDATASSEVMSITRELIEEFSTFDLFYSDRREDFKGYFRRLGSGEIWKESALMALAVLANNVEDGETEPEVKEKPDVIPEVFWGIHFDKWCDAFGRYAILLAHDGEDEGCFSTIDVAIQSNIFYRTETYHRQLQMCRLVCGLIVDDSNQASSAVRWLLRTYPYGTDIFRLYSCINRLCSFPEGFATGSAHKVLMRYIKTMDYVLLTPEQRVWYNFRGNDRTAWMQNAFSADITSFVKDHDPALFSLYAHVLMCGGSYMAALNYYFRAYAITPEDPVLNLSIGAAYIQHAIKRLSENRQYQIQQGLAFVNRYFDLRTKDNMAIHCQEAEFNVGRIWHSLGLVSQAVPAYERCIALSERVREEAMEQCMDGNWAAEDFSKEAAFAIQAIYAVSGNFEGARKVTEAVLVIE